MPERSLEHAPSTDQVATVRAFNRFYTRHIGALGESLLKSDFSLAEVRVLYELAHRERLTATDLAGDLGLDAGYLSRMLKTFEARGYLTRTRSTTDARQSVLSLTASGRAAFAPLDQAAHDEIAATLENLADGDRRKLVSAMQTVQRLLGGTAPPDVAYILRPHQPGDIGWITHRHGVLYAQEYGWDETFEALVAEITARFIRNHDPGRERCWIAEREGDIVGSVFLIAGPDETAVLRLLYVEPGARRLGIGRRLVDACVRFARAKGYRAVTLWTNDVLVSARRIYEAAGFTLVAQEPHHSFGKDLIGQNWRLDL